MMAEMNNTKPRCSWAANIKNPLYIEYHDKEWGRPVHDDRTLFEFLILEGAQAGLSWETVLNKRQAYIKAFAGFDPRKVAKFTAAQQKKLLKNEGIIRNRLKIKSAVRNAQIFLEMQKEFGSFSKYLWSHVGNKPVVRKPSDAGKFIARNELSDTISEDLKKRGMNFVGSTIIYAYLQAVGVVNDHTPKCFCYKRTKK